ncbi:hypothetical protein CKJ55_01905 [Mycobacterium avium]|nr:hypothetical protein CKJ55_01905 [Mycobacterium avium]PBA88145.1 hypothetical protein CKJ71_01900 [Mycobacterium avium]
MVVSPQRLTRWPSYVRDRHAAITYTTPRDAPFETGGRQYPCRFEQPAVPRGNHVQCLTATNVNAVCSALR